MTELEDVPDNLEGELVWVDAQLEYQSEHDELPSPEETVEYIEDEYGEQDEQESEEDTEESSEKESVSKSIFGSEQTGVSRSVFKEPEEEEAEWVPYEGPQGGDGWRNVNNPDQVSYDDEPPGSVPPPEKIANPALDIDPNDVEPNDYIRIEAEGGHFDDTSTEGIVSSVDRYRDSVDVKFVDGSTVTITASDAERVEVMIDDDFDGEQYREQVQVEDDLYGKVENQVEFEDWPDGAFSSTMMDEEDVTAEIAGQFGRAKVDLMDKTLDNLGDVKDKVPRSVYDQDTGEIYFSADGDTDVVHHELTHAVVNAFGYETKDEANVVSTLYTGDLNAVEKGKSFHETVDDLADQKLDDLKPFMTDQRERVREQAKNAKSQFEDFELKGDIFKLSGGDDDAPEELQNLIEEVNNSWETILEEEEDDGSQSAYIVEPYSGTNANETFAMFNELMQGGSVRKDDLEVVFDVHEDLLEAYLEVFEPAELQKQMLNETWEELQGGENEPDMDKPFPDMEEMEV